MVKAILFDADGVVLKKRDKYFSQRLVEDFGINVPEDKIRHFFSEIYPKIRLGKADLKVEVKKRMRSWGWQKSLDEFLKYWYDYENNIDNQVLDFVIDLRQKGLKCYLASDHSKYRADDLMNNVLGQYFDGGFFSGYLGCDKEDKDFYQAVLKKLKLKPEEILFVDDEEENVEVAKKMGMKAIYYQSFSDLSKVNE